MQMMLIDCSTFLQFHVAIVSEVEQSGVLLEALRGVDKSHTGFIILIHISELELSHQTIKEELHLCPLLLIVLVARHSLLQLFQTLIYFCTSL
jgi:hypothetical protein